ncbi:MAG: ATP-binding cassette domain-containing protein [Candidatus Marsarchaeota archaeon]|jgi:ABC-2 type transport system ATP-binding protein|nr:ATP-binding cassette domain-containing protein [Candidatus Marsarchaeota archaeon]
MPNIIEIHDLVKKFGELTAVDRISFYVKKGEIFGLLGPNGAGKTTTINMMIGLLRPTSGGITINGLDISRHTEEVKSLIGLMTQETVVETDLTARQNLEIFGRLYHIPRQELGKRIDAALSDADLVKFADAKAGTFSGGMQRRLELVKSMIQEPVVLILDEPTTGLDVQNRVAMWKRIRELRERGVTVILTTQYLEEADELCDRIAIIDHGRIMALGTAIELKSLVSKGNIVELTVRESEGEAAHKLIRSVKSWSHATLSGGTISVQIEREHAREMLNMLNTLQAKGIKVLSIGMHMPTMDDVFLKLTGSSMRDTTGAQTDTFVRAGFAGGKARR